MAAVLGETVTEPFPKMRRGDDRQRSPQYRQTSRSRPQPPESPRPQPRDAPASESPPQVREPQSSAIIVDPPETRPPFASQQHFSNPSQPVNSRPAYPAENSLHPSTAPRPHLASPAASATSPVARAARSAEDLARTEGSTVKVRDLAHIQSFATEEFISHRGQAGRRHIASEPPLKYEISAMPITDIIEMVAGLLTKITTTNDRQHENLHRPIPMAETAANLPGLTSSVLAFHGKNVPSITILSYLSRIHKYCPTTYEVFLSLLVYFDRMTERVNAPPIQEMRRGSLERNTSRPSTGVQSIDEDMEMPRIPVSGASLPSSSEDLSRSQYATPPDDDQITYNLSHFFVVDSFNIHRLVIAGVTCASKFFSDVFYTNSRYAKVSFCFLLSAITNLYRLVDYLWLN